MNQLKDVALSCSSQRLWPQVVELIIVAIVYWITVRLGLLVVAHPEGVASIWPASGLALAVLLLSPKNKWTRLLAVIFVTNAAGNWIGGNSFIVSLGFALANTIEPFFGAWVLSYLCTSKISFNRTEEIFALFGVAILCNGITALLGAAVPALAFDAPFLLTWRLWWAADGLGMILMTPIIVTWATSRGVLTSLSLRRVVETIVLVAMLATFAWLLFGPFTVAEKPLLRNYMVFPLLIWLAFRFNQRVMASALFLFATIAIWNTLQGSGYFGFAAQTVTEHLTSVQMFLMVSTFSGLLLNAMVSEHKKTVEALRESEEKYRIIFNNEIYAICIFDLETLRLLDVNEAYSRVYGYSREELISGMTVHDITAERQVSEVATRQAIKEGTIFIPLRYHRKKDGTVFPVEIVGGPYSWNGQKVMFALAHDITDRKAAEDVLIANETRFRSIINVSPMPMALNDGNQRITFLNPAFVQTFGYSQEDIPDLAHWWPQAYPDIEYRQKVADAWQAEIERSTQAGAPFSPQEVIVRCKDGSSKTILVSATSFSENIESNHLVVFYDITERKQAEEQSVKLEALNRQIQKAESLSTMAGSVAHHFNNKLGVVIGNLEMALDDLPPGADLHKKLTAAMQGALMAAEVSGLMLTYLGQKTGKRIPLDLSATCRKNLPLVQATAPNDLILNINLPLVGPTICGNANQIQQVLTNLVTNAWEAAGEKQCTVNLIVKTVTQTDIPANHRFPIDWEPQDLSYACMEVQDNGCGIAGKDIEKLFDPFFTTKFTGRGLGLPVVLGIVKGYNGVITVESETGKTTTVRVFIPVCEEALQQAENTTQPSTRDVEGTVV